MATITLTIQNTVVNRVLDAICNANGYRTTINGLPNPQTKSEFVKVFIATFLKSQVKEYESTIAANTASASAETDVENNINIT